MNKLFDLHIHSTFSDGFYTPSEIQQLYNKHNILFGISDHLSRYMGITDNEKLIKYIDTLDSLKIKKGIEIDLGYFPEKIERENLKYLDYIIGSIHIVKIDGNSFSLWDDSYYNQEYTISDIKEKYIQFIIKVLRSFEINIWGHPMMIPGFFYNYDTKIDHSIFSISDYERVLSVVKEKDIAIELSSRYNLPPEDMIKVALDLDLKFSIASDAHSPSNYLDLSYAEYIINKFDLKEKNFFNIF